MKSLGEPLLVGQETLSRDLGAARNAYASGDANASRVAHANPITVDPRASEAHQEGGGRVKSIVFGGCMCHPLPRTRRAGPARAPRPGVVSPSPTLLSRTSRPRAAGWTAS